MKVKELMALLEELSGDLEVEISVDGSTTERVSIFANSNGVTLIQSEGEDLVRIAKEAYNFSNILYHKLITNTPKNIDELKSLGFSNSKHSNTEEKYVYTNFDSTYDYESDDEFAFHPDPVEEVIQNLQEFLRTRIGDYK